MNPLIYSTVCGIFMSDIMVVKYTPLSKAQVNLPFAIWHFKTTFTQQSFHFVFRHHFETVLCADNNVLITISVHTSLQETPEML